MTQKRKFEDYTEAEYRAIIERLFQGDYSTEEELDALVDTIDEISEHPGGVDFLYYPDEGVEDSPQGVLKTIKQWRLANGKPGFKQA